MLSRQVHDPGIGFLTVTRVEVSADLQHARVYYTALGDEKARRESARALERASSFLRRQLAGRLRRRPQGPTRTGAFLRELPKAEDSRPP